MVGQTPWYHARCLLGNTDIAQDETAGGRLEAARPLMCDPSKETSKHQFTVELSGSACAHGGESMAV